MKLRQVIHLHLSSHLTRAPAIPSGISVALILYLVLPMACFGILRPEIGARAPAMGGAWIAQAEGPAALFWNPSGLATLQEGGVFYDLSQGALAASLPVPRLGTLAVGLVDLNDRDRFLIGEAENPIGTFETGYIQVLLSYARPISHWVLFGGSVSYSRMPHANSTWQVGYDLGMSLRLQKSVWLAARLKDIGNTQIHSDQHVLLEEFQQQFGFGFRWTPVSSLSLTSDLDTAQWRLRFGGETGLPWWRLRVGTLAELDEPRSPFYWSAGSSLRYGSTELSYAYVDGVEHPHRLSLKWTFDLHRAKRPRVETYPTAPDMRERDKPEVELEIPGTRTSPRFLHNQKRTARPPKAPNSGFLSQHMPPGRQVPLESETLIRIDPVPSLHDAEPPHRDESKQSMARKLADTYDVELEMILAVIRAESNFDPMAVSIAGAAGLTQLMPDTARSLGLKVPRYRNNRRPSRDPQKDERFHPRKNLVAGLAYLRALLDAYEGNYVLAISAYNAGPARVNEQVPSIRETEKHIGRVLNYYYQYRNSAEKRQAALWKLDQLLAPAL